MRAAPSRTAPRVDEARPSGSHCASRVHSLSAASALSIRFVHLPVAGMCLLRPVCLRLRRSGRGRRGSAFRTTQGAAGIGTDGPAIGLADRRTFLGLYEISHGLTLALDRKAGDLAWLVCRDSLAQAALEFDWTAAAEPFDALLNVSLRAV